MILLLSMAFVALPDRSDALLTKTDRNLLHIETSGSLGLFLGDSKCRATNPNDTLESDLKTDWCSNLVKENGEKPWISYHFTNKAMKLKGYAVRNGCCYYDYCCCDPDTGKYLDFACCCRLYSFSLLGSNDNKTWKTIHKVEKDSTIRWCQIKNYEFQTTESFNFVRLRMDEEKPGCPKCMQINQIELYGETKGATFYDEDFNNQDEDESVSIIGKIKRPVLD